MVIQSASNNATSRTVIKWNLPSEPTVHLNFKKIKSRENIDISLKQKMDNKFNINSPTLIGGAASVALLTVNTASQVSSSGVFLPIFLDNIFPLMLDVASVYVVIKIAMDFYKEQRGGGDSKDELGLGTVLKNGKWLLLFYLIPFFIKLLEQLGMQMANKVGG